MYYTSANAKFMVLLMPLCRIFKLCNTFVSLVYSLTPPDENELSDRQTTYGLHEIYSYRASGM